MRTPRPMVIASLALATLLVGTAAAPAASATTTSRTTYGGVVRDEAAELQVLRDLQVQNRIADGVPAQTWSTNLAGVASRWAHRMAESSNSGQGPAAMVHSTTDDDYDFGTHINQSFSWAAENIGWTGGTPEGLNQAWLDSPPHRSSLSDPKANCFGIGTAYDDQGRLWATTVFAWYRATDPDDPSTDHPLSTPPPTPVTPPTPPPAAPPVPPVTTPTPTPDPQPPAPAPLARITPLSGTDRYATSVVVARQAAPQAHEVIIVNGADGSVDSLAGGPLAASIGAGLVLTAKDSLPDSVASYLQAQNISKTYVLGGTSAVSQAVTDRLTELGVSVERISGRDRYETSVKVSATPSLRDSSTVVVAGGTALADAVSAGGIAGALHAPVVLVPGKGTLPTGLYDTTTARATVVVAGSTGVVSDDVARQLGAGLRLGGRDRYETSLAIARWGIDSGVPADAVAVTTAEGTNTADALSAAALGRITLLTPRAAWSDGIRQFLAGHQTQQVFTVGGQTPRA